jgi:hypothetical protein
MTPLPENKNEIEMGVIVDHTKDLAAAAEANELEKYANKLEKNINYYNPNKPEEYWLNVYKAYHLAKDKYDEAGDKAGAERVKDSASVIYARRPQSGGKKSRYSRKLKSKYSRKPKTKYSRKPKTRHSRKY